MVILQQQQQNKTTRRDIFTQIAKSIFKIKQKLLTVLK